jgi:hypothetical protein
MAKITFERTGGFAGVTLSTELDPAALPEADAARARKLIDEAKLFEQPKQIKSRSSMPDQFEYKLTIRDKGKRHTIVVGDQSTPANLKPLVEFLLAQARKR